MRQGENEGDLRSNEYNLLSDEQKKSYSLMIFDEDFERGGYEDVSLFLRARDTFGMKIIMSEEAIYWHKEGATRWGIEEGGFCAKSKGYDQRNREKFAQKWGFDYYQKNVWISNELVS